MSLLPAPARRALSALVEAHLAGFGKTYAKARAHGVPPRGAYARGTVVALFLAPVPTMRRARREWATACEEEITVRRARGVLA